MPTSSTALNYEFIVAVLHDGAARVRARGRPRLTSGLRGVRDGSAEDAATTTRILVLPFREIHKHGASQLLT